MFDIVKIGHPGLRKVCAEVEIFSLRDPELKSFIESMKHTMYEAQGVGLAANQIAHDTQVIVLECASNKRYPDAGSFPFQAYINPRIVRYSEDKETDWEGCLSIPGYRGLVPRSKEVTFEALTPEGKSVVKTVKGFEARVMQHEVDHINGFFYVDRMEDLKSWTHLDEYGRHISE